METNNTTPEQQNKQPNPQYIQETRQPSSLHCDKTETHLPDHVGEEAEVEASTDSSQHDESEGQVGADRSHPDGVEGVAQLDPSLTHVKNEEAEAATQHSTQVAPVHSDTVPLYVILWE